MTLPFLREFKLAGEDGDGRWPYLNDDGAFLGDGVALLERDAQGLWRPRPRETLQRLLDIGYGDGIDADRRIAALASVARALNAKATARAAMTLVHAGLPPLDDPARARKMAEADALLNLSVCSLMNMLRVAVLISFVFEWSARPAEAKDIWGVWLSGAHRLCPSHRLDLTTDGVYFDLLDGFEHKLKATSRNHVDKRAAELGSCIGTNGYTCEASASLQAYADVGLMNAFVRYSCRYWRCEDIAMCTTTLRLPPLKFTKVPEKGSSSSSPF